MEPLTVWVTEWVMSSLFGGLLYQEVAKWVKKDEYTHLTHKALAVLLKEEDNRMIWNTINEKSELMIHDPLEFDASQICDQFPAEEKSTCQNFFSSLQKEYLRQLCDHGKKDPFGKYIIQKLSQLENHEYRIAQLEQICPDIVTLFMTHQKFLEDRVEKVKKIIKAEIPDISDFVGRGDIIADFPDENVYIQGNAAIGKTFLLLKLCESCEGYYIPLEKVHETAVFELLIREAENMGRRIFIDDFQSATDEIAVYVQSYLTNVVIASREKCRIKRPFHGIRVGVLQEEDIRAYFSFHGLTITDEVLNLLKEDLNFPIKLRIFVNYMKKEGILTLDLENLVKVFDNLEIEKFQLPDELADFYEIFVFNHFNRKQKDLCNILSLLRFPASIGRLSGISGMSEGEIPGLLKKMEGILAVYESKYSIFHESFREYCITSLGDTQNLNKKIGIYFEDLTETDDEIEGIVEAMYHYRISGLKSSFKLVFNLPVINALIWIGRWSEARDDLEFALKTSLNEKVKADTLQIFGILLYKQGEWDKAIEYYEKDLEIFERLGDVHGMAQTFGNLGLVYARKGEWDKAIEYYEKDLEISERLGDVHGMAQTFGNLGLVYADKGEWDKAIEYYEKDLEISERLGDVHGMAQTYNNLGLVYADKGEWDKAIEYYEKSLKDKERLGDVHGMAQTFVNLGLVYADKGEWDKAIEYYEKDLEIFERLGDVHGMAQTYNNLGLVYARKGEWDKAIEYYEKSLKDKERLGDVHGMAQTFGNLGLVYADKGEWDKAIEYYEKDLEISERLGDVHGMAQTYNNLGLVYADKGEWDKAIEYYEKSLKDKERLGDVHGMAMTQVNVAHILLQRKKHDEALKLYHESEKVIRQIGDTFNLMKVYYQLAACYDEIKQKKNADKYFNLAEDLRERLGIEID